MFIQMWKYRKYVEVVSLLCHVKHRVLIDISTMEPLLCFLLKEDTVPPIEHILMKELHIVML